MPPRLGAVLPLLALSLLPLACSASADLDDASSEDEGAATSRRATSAPVYIDLGKVKSGVGITFDIPAGALGFNILVENESAKPGALVSIAELRGPSGKALVSESMVLDGPAFAMIREKHASLQVPSTDAALDAPVAGRWSATFEGYDGTTGLDANAELHVKLVVQATSDGAFHGGLLDLHVYVPDALTVQDPTPPHAIDATSAKSDACVKARVDGFYSALSTMAGIDRGKVTFHRVPAVYGRVLGDSLFRSYIEESKVVGDKPALHVMLTNVIALTPGVTENELWGVSPAQGGSAGRGGTGLSGVVLSIDPMFSASGDALTLLHEAGHFMGLAHTSEVPSKNGFDALADTAECTGGTQENFRSCPDGRNLMFALFYGASEGGVGVHLSRSQNRVVHGAPVYRPYAASSMKR